MDDTTAQQFETFLNDALVAYEDDNGWAPVESVSTYAEFGVLTTDSGLVVRLADGSEFQVTVVKSA